MSYLIILLLALSFIISTDLSPEIIDTLMADHERMKHFRENYNRLSCKLLIVSKIKAMFELEEIDYYTDRIHPNDRAQFLEELKKAMIDKCLSTYKEDKIIFEDKLFYSYPNPDNEYRGYYFIDIEEILAKYPAYKSEKPKKKRRSNNEDSKGEQSEQKELKPKEEKVDL